MRWFFLSYFPLTVSSFFTQLLFSKIKKELLLVALFSQEKFAIPLQKAFHSHRGYKPETRISIPNLVIWDKIFFSKIKEL
jgi:hypothetical protein